MAGIDGWGILMAQGERRWFLLVEDNEDEERLARRAFSRSGLQAELVVAHDGEEAIKLLESCADDLPCFALLDIKMPRVDGIEVLKWMRSQEKFWVVPAIVMVGSAAATDLGSIYRFGANSLVRKELEYDVYMEKIVPMLKYWMEINVLPQS
jgi:two-component system, response regulator